MKHSDGIARTLYASGRFLILSLGLLLGCAAPQPRGEISPDRALPDPVVEPGNISRGRTSQAARLFGQAVEAYENGRFAEARALAERVASEYAASPVSGRALFLQAQAALGQGRLEEAVDAADRYAGLLHAQDPRIATALLLQADALALSRNQAARLSVLLRMDQGAPVNARLRGAEQAREAAASLDLDTMTRLLGEQRADGPLTPIAFARYAVLSSASPASGETPKTS